MLVHLEVYYCKTVSIPRNSAETFHSEGHCKSALICWRENHNTFPAGAARKPRALKVNFLYLS